MSLKPATYAETKATHKHLSRSKPLARGKGVTRKKKSVSGAKKGKKRAKKLTNGQLKKRVWVQFSIFIRTRGADENGMNTCITCQVVKKWSELQAGHFIAGRLNANLFSEIGTQPQCSTCNVLKAGNTVLYYKWMLAHFGQDVIDELILQNSQTHKWGATELADLLAKYTALNQSNPVYLASLPQ